MMKHFLIANLFLIMAAAAISPAALATGRDESTAVDLNGDGVVSIQERRIHYFDNSTN